MAPEFYGFSLQISEIIKNTVNKAIIEVKTKYSAPAALISAASAACPVSVSASAATPSVCETPAACKVSTPAAALTPSAYETPAACKIFIPAASPPSAPKAFFFCAFARAKSFSAAVFFYSLGLLKLL